MNAPNALGTHLIAELDDCARLPDEVALADILTRAAAAGHATLLAVHTHTFGGAGGVAGIALLAESHVSVHTWPEYRYAAVDVFMCGTAADPEAALMVLRTALGAGGLRVARLSRNATPPERPAARAQPSDGLGEA